MQGARIDGDTFKQVQETTQEARLAALRQLYPWLADKLSGKLSAGDTAALLAAYHARYGKPGEPRYEAAKRHDAERAAWEASLTPEQHAEWLAAERAKRRAAKHERLKAKRRAEYLASKGLKETTGE